MSDRLIVRGAREHNLRDVSLDLPRDAMIVFTGLSGSGKSSLAFDTIFAEGQRRYVESLSSYARQFLGQMDKPDVDFIEGLSPAVSIDQKSTSRNPRSTVGTITEVYDYLRLLFARVGEPHCPNCGRPISRQTPQQIVDRVLAMDEGTRFQVLAPVIRGRKGEYVDLFADLQSQGFARVRVDGVVHQLTDPPKLKKQEKHTIEVVVDRLAVKASAKQRLTDSIETALKLAAGVVVLEFVDLPEDDEHRERTFSEHLACPYGDLSFEALEPRSFSFNAPYGACPECSGLGTKKEVDPELIIPDPERSLREGAIQPWSGGHTLEYFLRLLEALGTERGLQPRHAVAGAVRPGAEDDPVRRPRTRCTCGTATSTAASGPTTPGSRASCSGSSGGTATPSRTGRATSTRATCATCRVRRCGGARLKPEILAVTIGGKNIAEVCGAVRRRLLRAARRDGADRPAADDRRAGAQGDQRAAAVPGRRRSRLPVARPAGRHAVRRRGAADPARDADRFRSGRRALRARRAVDRPAPARQPPADRDAGTAAQPRQHADRRRARRGHDPDRRLDRRHRTGRRRARRRHRAQRHVRGPADERAVDHRRLPVRPPVDPDAARSAGRRRRAASWSCTARASTTCTT